MIMENLLQNLTTCISKSPKWDHTGQVSQVFSDIIHVTGLQEVAHIGDQVHVRRSDGGKVAGEIVRISKEHCVAMLHGGNDQIGIYAKVTLKKTVNEICPSESWKGRILDPFCRPLDERPLLPGRDAADVHAPAPDAARRAEFGDRLNTGFLVFNTFLPLVAGQRLGLFSGAGVGKSTLLAALSTEVEADVVVIAMIGERGHEVRKFVDNTLGAAGLARSIIVAATSDQSALMRRRCPQTAMAIAEHYRSKGQNVLFLADSITRFAEAHREISLANGELPAMRGYPPSTAKMIMSLCERAGPGVIGEGTITAVFSVLVAGSDLDEPIADILRGVLDGHVVLDRDIAERGRFPAINVLRSVSRSLPAAASDEENALLKDARRLLAAYEKSSTMIKAGLYAMGSDPLTDRAIRIWEELDSLFAKKGEADVAGSYAKLSLLLRRSLQN